jgi:hypothetical protein
MTATTAALAWAAESTPMAKVDRNIHFDFMEQSFLLAGSN